MRWRYLSRHVCRALCFVSHCDCPQKGLDWDLCSWKVSTWVTWFLLSAGSDPSCREPCPAVWGRCMRSQWEHPAGKWGELDCEESNYWPTWKGCSRAWLISFHRPPTCNKDWELNTVKCRPIEMVELYFSHLLKRKKNIFPEFPIIFKLIWDYFKIRFMQFCVSFMFIFIMPGPGLARPDWLLSHHLECW